MPKTTTVAMKAHIQQEVTSLCSCWKITRKDGVVLAFTDHDTDLTYLGDVYKASSGFKRTAVTGDETLAVANLDILGILDSTSITANDLRNGVYDYAQVEVFLLNWADLTQGRIAIRRGVFGEISVTPTGVFRTELRGLAQYVNYQFGELYSPACRADLGDTRCKVNLASFSVTGTVAGVSVDRAVFSVSGFAQPSSYFDYGAVTWITGDNAGARMEVKSWTNSSQAFTLFLPMPRPIQIGDTFSVHAGCNKARQTCKDKFNNVINFRGEPDLPGRDNVLSYGA